MQTAHNTENNPFTNIDLDIYKKIDACLNEGRDCMQQKLKLLKNGKFLFFV